jgi:hypothetical protein
MDRNFIRILVVGSNEVYLFYQVLDVLDADEEKEEPAEAKYGFTLMQMMKIMSAEASILMVRNRIETRRRLMYCIVLLN